METTPTVGVGRRRIIKRPRLTRMLDESGARIILLVAPAGYGKTTLAHEWLDAKRAAWYRGSAASADVAALAVGIASAAAEVIPGAGDRMRQRLRATDRPEEDARILAEMLAEDLEGWPDDAWLAIDDYHFAMESPAAETFVGALTECGALQLITASRHRPRWATARLRVYGHVLELDRTLLAMSDGEALDVLADRHDASELVEPASGWPAVIGLAALTVGSTIPSGRVPATLYDFFAEELLQGADREAQIALCRLSAMPWITSESASFLLGEEAARRALSESVASGILLPQQQDHFDFHPLFRTFLQERLSDLGVDVLTATVNRAGMFLLRLNRWDDALSLAQRFPVPAFLDAFIGSAWEAMLDEGRMETLSRLIDLVGEQRQKSGLVDLVEAEIACRQGAYRKAETLALEASRRLEDSHHSARAFMRAGQSAHLEGRDVDAIDHHRHAQALAHTESDRRDALWGEFVCAIELESEDCRQILERFEQLGDDDARTALRIANGRMLLATRTGSGIDPAMFSAVHRLPKVDNPTIRSSFLNMWACVLAFTGRYREASEVSQQQLDEAKRYRLDFALPHAYIRRAIAHRGLRQFRESHNCLRTARRGHEALDDYVAISTDTAQIALYLALGDLKGALAIPEPTSPTAAAPNAVAELIATRALAMACAGALDEADAAAIRAHDLSSAAEPRLLAKFTRVVIAFQRESPDRTELLADTLEDIVRSGNIDAFVTSYRAYSQLLLEAVRTGDRDVLLGSILAGANDMSLAERVIPARLSAVSGRSPLTAREREVLMLIAEGNRNREIAQRLFISEVTVKAHVRNILRKLGARSRAQAVSLAALVD